MAAKVTRDDAAEFLDGLRDAVAAIDAGEPVEKVTLEPAVALAQQLLGAADSDPGAGPSAMAVMVAEFHEHPHSTGRAATVARTPSLHAEEYDELLEAIELDDAAAIARELADIVYIAFSEAWARGLDLDARSSGPPRRDRQDRRQPPRPGLQAHQAAGFSPTGHNGRGRRSGHRPRRAP